MKIKGIPNAERLALFLRANLAQVGLGGFMTHRLGKENSRLALSTFLAKHFKNHPIEVLKLN
jgi:hypothetical protein